MLTMDLSEVLLLLFICFLLLNRRIDECVCVCGYLFVFDYFAAKIYPSPQSGSAAWWEGVWLGGGVMMSVQYHYLYMIRKIWRINHRNDLS
jgi:hypothetical protein